jgi:tripartite-type tricarboxylate transporter receptor subunit TctC
MHPIHRRAALGIVLAGLAGGALAQADAWPARPIKIVVGYQVGGPTDLTARLVATQLGAALGQPVVVENKPGAGSNLASEMVAAAAPDGYTLLLAAAPITINSFLYKSVKYDVQKSFEPVVNVMTAPSVLAVAPGVPARTLQELVALAKKEPGKLSYGSSGNGGTQHLAGELFKQRAGIDVLHVPYKGASSALSDLMAGQISMVFMTSMSALPHLKAGNPRPIAVAADTRLPQLPDVPTLAESGFPGFEAESWNGLFAPAGTPRAIVDRLNRAVNAALAQPAVRDALVAQGAVPVGGSPDEFRRYVASEVSRWGKLLQTLKVSLD